MIYNPEETMQYTWYITTLVVGKNSQDAKSIDHLNAGIGYYMLEAPTNTEKYYIVGFKYFIGEILPHWEKATSYQVEKLEKMDKSRYYCISH